MPILLPHGYHWDHELKQGKETAVLTELLWPNYLVLESDIPEPGLKVEITAQEFAQRFPVWGIRRDSGNALVAYASGAQLAVDPSANQLPNSGWRFAIQAACEKTPPNCLCLLVANIHPDARRLGFSQILINRAKQAARELGFNAMIGPVRPTLKHAHPLMNIADYASKRGEDGEIYDPWIKAHVSLGAEILNLCTESVRVRATLTKWREWTKLPLQNSGNQILPQGLVPLKVDTTQNLGEYLEPNIWVRYRL